VIPVHNEQDGLAHVVRSLRATLDECGCAHEIVVVDDGSTDATLQVAEGLDVRLVRHALNRGYGAALKSGIRAAAGEHILICDGDGTYPAESIPSLLARLDGHDMVVAARTGALVHMPWPRRLAKGFLRRLAMYLSETHIPDLNSGLRLFRRDTALAFFTILPNGFSFTTTITLALLCNEGSVAYVPIDYTRRTGRSKIRPVRDTINFLVLIMRTILYFNPLKIFLPVSLAIGLMFTLSLAYDIFLLRDLTEKTLILLLGSLQLLALGVLADLITKRLYGGAR
jgi:glycosyltransferase involved in cell wall biosynthesis